MGLKRLDNVSIVVEDLDGAIAFFSALGLEVLGTGRVGGEWVEKVLALDGVDVDMAMMAVPGGTTGLEITRFRSPAPINDGLAPVQRLGMQRLMFTVDSVDEAFASLEPLGAELVGEIVDYEDTYRLCFIRGPEGLLLALAEELFETPEDDA